MKQVPSIVARLAQRVSAKRPVEARDRRASQPVELDARDLKHVAGGNGASLPNKGW